MSARKPGFGDKVGYVILCSGNDRPSAPDLSIFRTYRDAAMVGIPAAKERRDAAGLRYDLHIADLTILSTFNEVSA